MTFCALIKLQHKNHLFPDSKQCFDSCKTESFKCPLMWSWHQNIWLHFAVAGHASLSCSVLLIWPLYTDGSVMSITPTPLPMWMDRLLSHTSVHTHSK